MRRVHLLFLGLLLSLLIESSFQCGIGFSIEDGKCVDEDECNFENPVCGDNADCKNTIGSYNCQCEEGYQQSSANFTAENNKGCKDFNECRETPDICGDNAQCHNSIGSYFCTCNDGFVASNKKETFIANQGVTCKDRDECEMDPDICGVNAACHNTIGGYYCTCDPGYMLQSGQTNFTSGKCEYINECIKTPGICGDNAQCNNSMGSYFCTCNDGFVASNGKKTFNASQGVTCEDVCDINRTNCGNGSCKKMKNGYECECNSGFTNYGYKTMRCSKPNFGPLKEHNTAQTSPSIQQIVDKLKSSFEELVKGKPVNGTNLWQVEGLLEELLGALDELLSAGPLNSNTKVTALLELTENVLKLLGPFLPNTTTATVHTEIEVLVRRGEPPPQGAIVLSTTDTQLETHWETATGDSYLGFTAAILLSYKGLESSVNDYFNWIEKQEDEVLRINSNVVTVAVTNPDTAQLNKEIILTLPHLQQPSDSNQRCVFWNSALGGGAWSTKGCTVVKSNSNHTVCSCTHLSSFAVLMALHEMEDVFELQLITWVGLSLSLICLFICILTFRFVRSIQSTRTTIHLHLCISLFIANLIFLVGITRTENEVGCGFVAGLLHFFFLAAFCWMCLEGVQLFRMVVLVFNTTLRPLYLMAGGYGIPALIVVISASINAKGYGTKRHCWLDLKDGFIWSFFGPVCAIIVVNVFFFLITVWKLAQKFSSINQDLSKLHKIKSFTVTAIAQLCVLGTMWIFGCFQFEGSSLVMSYIFTILNSLQGVLVFVMHCLLSKQVREEYAKILFGMCLPQKKKYTEFSTNQSSKSQASRSIQNTGESNI